MHTETCTKCGTVLPADQIEYTLVGAFCSKCRVAETVDADRLGKELTRSIGRRQLFVGLFMLAVGIGILSLGVAGGAIAVLPVGLLVGGLIEIAQGGSKL